MSWEKSKSLDRIRRRWEARDTEITVSKLGREMDLENITLKNGRRINGAHLYVTVAGSGRLDQLDDADDAASAIQRIALWQAEVSRIAKAFEVPIIAFQGARVHLLGYRPIDDEAAIARKTALLARAITYMTRDSFNPLFDTDEQLKARAATDLGETVGTRGGTRGDSELLFIGSAANRPAKLLGASRLVATGGFVDALGDQLTLEKEEKTGASDAYVLKISLATVEEAVAEDGIDWSIETSSERLVEELEKWPASRFKVSGASELIDPGSLSRSNSKRVLAAVILMDIDKFSEYVERSESDTVKRDAILALDAIRQEMREVLKVDYKGVRVQYQGDNMIGLVHLPDDEEEKIAETAVEIAAAMESSMNVTLPEVVLDALSLDVVVGIALEETVISSLGGYGRRNAIVIGPAATKSEQIQLRLEARTIGVDKQAYEALPGSLAELFSWSASAGAYVAEIDASTVARVKEAAAAAGERTMTCSASDRRPRPPRRSSVFGRSALTLTEERRSRYAEDRAVLAEVCPSVRHEVRMDGRGATAQGPLEVDIGAGCWEPVDVLLAFGPRYPETPPRVFDRLRRWAPEADRHIMPGGEFCLWLEHVDAPSFSSSLELRDLILRLLAFLRDQFVFDDIQRWPGPEWPHGPRAAYAQFLIERLRIRDREMLLSLWPALLGAPQRTDRSCPCGSGLIYSRCHLADILELSWVRALPAREQLPAAIEERLADAA
jgi:hypothetical protein